MNKVSASRKALQLNNNFQNYDNEKKIFENYDIELKKNIYLKSKIMN